MNVYQILTELGYKLKDYGKEYRAKPLYRESDNDTVLKIYKDTGHWFDFKENISGDFNSLISMTLNLEDSNKAKEWLKNKNFENTYINVNQTPSLNLTKTFEKNLLVNFLNDHEYWLNRNISLETISMFQGGVVKDGKMKNRYVFPIFNIKKEIVGFSGRDISNKSKIKWKHIGEKSNWCYPTFLNLDSLKIEKQIYLVESIGDCLSLWEAGIKNTIVTFGLDINISILNLLLKIAPEKIFISFNNDTLKNNAGNIAAEKIYRKLLRYFDKKQLQIKLPYKKDFGEMNKEEILQWKSNL